MQTKCPSTGEGAVSFAARQTEGRAQKHKDFASKRRPRAEAQETGLPSKNRTGRGHTSFYALVQSSQRSARRPLPARCRLATVGAPLPRVRAAPLLRARARARVSCRPARIPRARSRAHAARANGSQATSHTRAPSAHGLAHRIPGARAHIAPSEAPLCLRCVFRPGSLLCGARVPWPSSLLSHPNTGALTQRAKVL